MVLLTVENDQQTIFKCFQKLLLSLDLNVAIPFRLIQGQTRTPDNIEIGEEVL